MCVVKFIYWVLDTCDLLYAHEYTFININIYNETNGKYSHNDTLKCNIMTGFYKGGLFY